MRCAPTGAELVAVQCEEKEILRNLLEKYDYEFSQYDQRDVNALGLYGYNWLDCYWTEKNRYPFFIKVNGALAGFVMVNDHPEVEHEPMDYSIAEFFVMYKYRRMGLGVWAAHTVFDRFRGRWQVKRHPHNVTSVRFWDKAVGEYTGGAYTVKRLQSVAYDDGTPGEVLFFNT